MSIDTIIVDKLKSRFNPAHLEVDNESHMHSGPATDSHYRLVVVSDEFSGKRLVQRHQLIYGLFQAELDGPVHALSMHLYTEAEWADKSGQAPLSPKCLGGSKADK